MYASREARNHRGGNQEIKYVSLVKFAVHNDELIAMALDVYDSYFGAPDHGQELFHRGIFVRTRHANGFKLARQVHHQDLLRVYELFSTQLCELRFFRVFGGCEVFIDTLYF